jgi:hypothetical protein
MGQPAQNPRSDGPGMGSVTIHARKSSSHLFNLRELTADLTVKKQIAIGRYFV